MPSSEAPRSYPLITFAQQWVELSQQAGLTALSLARDSRKWRGLWLREMSQTMDRYMRSPAFVQVMHYNLEVMTRSKALFSKALLSPLRRK